MGLAPFLLLACDVDCPPGTVAMDDRCVHKAQSMGSSVMPWMPASKRATDAGARSDAAAAGVGGVSKAGADVDQAPAGAGGERAQASPTESAGRAAAGAGGAGRQAQPAAGSGGSISTPAAADCLDASTQASAMQWVAEFGTEVGDWQPDKHVRLLADVNADGKDDVVGFGNDGISVALSTGSGFSAPSSWSRQFGYDAAAGGWRVDRHVRLLADMDGDKRADVVGFGEDGISVALSTGAGFRPAELWVAELGYSEGAGGWHVDRHPRVLADVNGDGRADAIGFGEHAVIVALSTGAGFASTEAWVQAFGYAAGDWRVEQHPRLLGDLNGDGRADIAGFHDKGVEVSLSTGSSFGAPELWIAELGLDQGWLVDRHPRALADVDGDGRMDVVGFGESGTHVALSTGKGLGGATRWVEAYGYAANAGAWRADQHPRLVRDVDGDRRADVVAFGNRGVCVSYSRDASFTAPELKVVAYAYDAGWRVDRHPRFLSDVSGDGAADIVGFGSMGVFVTTSVK